MLPSRDITPRVLMRFLRGECPPQEDASVRAALAEDPALRRLFQQLHDDTIDLCLSEMDPNELGEPMEYRAATGPGLWKGTNMLNKLALAAGILLIPVGVLVYVNLPKKDAPPPESSPVVEFTMGRNLSFADFETQGKAPRNDQPHPGTPPGVKTQPWIAADETGVGPLEAKDLTESKDRRTDDDDVLVDDSYAIAAFTHLDLQWHIYVTKKFMRLTGGVAPTDKPLNEFTFYLKPAVLLNQGELDKAFENKTKAEKSKDGAEQYRIHFTVKLVTPEVKQAALARINEKYPKAGLALGDIALISPRKLTLFVRLGDQVQELNGGSFGGESVANQPESLEVSLTATEAVLKEFVGNAPVYASYNLRGFRIKQNSLHASLHFVLATKLHHALTGQAGFKQSRELIAKGRSGGLRLPFFGYRSTGNENYESAKFDSWVSRRQVREVTLAAVHSLNVSQWTETLEQGEAMDRLAEQVVNQLLTRAQERTIKDVKEIVDQNNKVTDFKSDLQPDVVGELMLAYQQNYDSAAKALREATISKDGSVTGKSNEEYTDKDGVTWTSKTGPANTRIIVPKSIQVYQFNDTALKDEFASLITKTEAIHVERPSTRQPAVALRNIPAVHQDFVLRDTIGRKGPKDFALIGGNDDEMHTGPWDARLQLQPQPPELGKPLAANASLPIAVRWWAKEKNDNYTEIEFKHTLNTCTFPAHTFGKKLVAFGPYDDVDQHRSGKGKQHDWIHLDDQRGFKGMRIKIDGSGDELKEDGNIGFHFEVEIPYKVEMEPPRIEKRVRGDAQAQWTSYNPK